MVTWVLLQFLIKGEIFFWCFVHHKYSLNRIKFNRKTNSSEFKYIEFFLYNSIFKSSTIFIYISLFFRPTINVGPDLTDWPRQEDPAMIAPYLCKQQVNKSFMSEWKNCYRYRKVGIQQWDPVFITVFCWDKVYSEEILARISTLESMRIHSLLSQLDRYRINRLELT